MNIRMMGNRVLIEPVEEETKQGFIVPPMYREYRTGIVRAVGNGARMKNGERRQIPLNVGDAIVLSDDYRMPIDIEGKEHFIVSDEKVLCVLEKQPEQNQSNRSFSDFHSEALDRAR